MVNQSHKVSFVQNIAESLERERDLVCMIWVIFFSFFFFLEIERSGSDALSFLWDKLFDSLKYITLSQGLRLQGAKMGGTHTAFHYFVDIISH